MGIDVLVVSRNVALWDYIDRNKVCTYEHMGRIEDDLCWEREKFKSKNIIQFCYIGIGFYTVFNKKQVRRLKEDIKIVEKLNIIDKNVMHIIKQGVDLVLKNNDLYLKFEDD